MNLILIVSLNEEGPNTFEVYRKLNPVDIIARNSVIAVEYNYAPWPRYGGNILW